MHENTVLPPPLLLFASTPNMATLSPRPKEIEQILPTMVDTHPPRPLNSHTKWTLCGASSLGISHSSAQCDEYNPATIHCTALYKYSILILIRAFPSEGRTTWVRRYRDIARVLLRNVLPVPHGTYMYEQPIFLARRCAKRGFQCKM
jgi:hypothetical protein